MSFDWTISIIKPVSLGLVSEEYASCMLLFTVFCLKELRLSHIPKTDHFFKQELLIE